MVGLDIWNDRDKMQITTDHKVLLENFKIYREKYILPYYPHDNAQLIS